MQQANPQPAQVMLFATGYACQMKGKGKSLELSPKITPNGGCWKMGEGHVMVFGGADFRFIFGLKIKSIK